MCVDVCERGLLPVGGVTKAPAAITVKCRATAQKDRMKEDESPAED